jgi:hypothetical protein
LIPAVDSDWIKDQIDAVRESIGRNITLYYSSRDACTICVASGLYDPISDTSWYTVCPQCHGAYWLNTVDSREVLARVHWVSNEGITATPGGKYFLGDAQITVDPSEHEWLVKAQSDAGKVVVDGQDFSITRINPMGAPTINRTRAVLRAMGARPTE